MRDDERELIRRAQNGETAAFEELAAYYQQPLLRMIGAVARNAEDANDCLQETLLRAYRALPYYRAESSFSTWIHRVALNTSRNWVRSEARASSLRFALRLSRLAPEVAEPPERQTLENEQREMVRRALCKLPHHYREAIVLRHYQNMSYDQIAAVAGVPVGTVRSRIAEGRRLLARSLDALGYGIETEQR